jgi:hypothetical protein
MSLHPKWSGYALLQHDDDNGDANNTPLRPTRRGSRLVLINLFVLVLAMSLTAVVTSAVFVLTPFWTSSTTQISGYQIYCESFTKILNNHSILTDLPCIVLAPAAHVVSYETVLFTQGEGDDKTEYQDPPSEAIDEKWAELFDRKCKSQATG